jgi:hypothetical protein
VADPVVRDLADAIVDGESIDWHAVETRLASPHDKSVAEGLKTLSTIVVPDPRSTRRRASARLPLVLEFARAIAIASTGVGLVGTIIAVQRLEVPRLGVMTAVLLTFAAVAVLLDVGSTARRTRALAACYWVVAASFAASGVRWLAQTWPAIPLISAFTALHAECFFSATFWQFARDFPLITRFSGLDRVCVMWLRAVSVLGAALFIINLSPSQASAPWFYSWVGAFQRMTRGSWFWPLEFGTALPAFAVIAWRGRRATGEEAARVRIFLYGVAASMIPVALEVVAEGMSEAFRVAARTPYWRSFGAWLVYPPLFLLPTVTAYAAAIDNVLDYRVVIQRGLRYLMARWLVTGGAGVPLVLLLGHLYRQSSRSLADALSDRSARLLIIAAIGGAMVLACRQYVLRALDRWVLPNSDEAPAVLAHMAERMKHARTPLEVTSEFAGAAERALQATAHGYLMLNGTLTPLRLGGVPMPTQSLVPVLLEGSREPCVVSGHRGQSYYSLMTERDRAWIDAQRIAVIVPIASGRRSAGLLGMVALEQRRNALTFSPDDLRFLRAATAAASLACDVISTEMAPGEGLKPPEEVGLQCAACGCVEEWDVVGRACRCTQQRWEPAVLPVNLLGRFRISNRLGAGGMGVVYRASELSLGRDVAVKTLARLSPGAASRLRLEARAMASLEHPHIAVIYGVETWRGTPLLTMEYLAGGTLAARLEEQPLPVCSALRMAQQLAFALEHVHRSGRYHGDIKPSNIGFTADNAPKFLDFGLSQAIDETADPSPARRVAGTPAYMAPENFDGAPAGPTSDLWALSVVLYESVTGTNPFRHAQSGDEVMRTAKDALALSPLPQYPCLRDYFAGVFRPAADRAVRTAAGLRAALAVAGEALVN